ncbi:Elongation factor 1-alpha [Hordeum vulgare]|nr:Elongation factor 1-alpha [Hordeum vulgare]
MEDVEGMLGSLSLSEAELQGVRIGRKDTGAVGRKEVQAIGKVISEKPAMARVLESTLGMCWCPMKGVVCKDLGDNIFLFTFGQESGKRKAVEEGPWWYGKELIVMEDFDPMKLIEEYEFNKVPIWVQIFRLPLGMMDRASGEGVGGAIGEVQEVETDEDGKAVGKYLRVKVKLNITKPLMRGSMVQIDERGRKSCHVERECKAKVKKDEKAQFGRWLRDEVEGRRLEDRGRSSGSGSISSGGGKNFGFGKWGSQGGSDRLSWRKEEVKANGKSAEGANEEEVQSPLKLSISKRDVTTEGGKEGRHEAVKRLKFDVVTVEGGGEDGSDATTIAIEVKGGRKDIVGTESNQEAWDEEMAVSKEGKGGEVAEVQADGIAGKAKCKGDKPGGGKKFRRFHVMRQEGVQQGEGIQELSGSKRKVLEEEGSETGRWKLGLASMWVVKPDGRSRGIAAFWRREMVLSLRSSGRRHIDFDVTEPNGDTWRLTGVYGESQGDRKKETWKMMRILGQQHENGRPWLCLGDFNEILTGDEKCGGVARPQSCMDQFRDALESCGLNDLGYCGDKFTWRNHCRDVDGYICERLDRAMGNSEWAAKFPTFKVTNGNPRRSDHRPILVDTQGG